MENFEACVQAIHFLLKTFGEMDKLKIVKLLYLADKWHLISYNRTITGYDFLATKHGPAGCMVLDVLNRNMEYLSQEQLDFIDEHIQQSDTGKDIYTCVNRDVSYIKLSESDEKAMKMFGEKFKAVDKWAIVDLTRQYPEWTQFKKELEQNPAISKQIPLEDMFSSIDDDPVGISTKIIELSKQLFEDDDDECEWDYGEETEDLDAIYGGGEEAQGEDVDEDDILSDAIFGRFPGYIGAGRASPEELATVRANAAADVAWAKQQEDVQGGFFGMGALQKRAF